MMGLSQSWTDRRLVFEEEEFGDQPPPDLRHSWQAILPRIEQNLEFDDVALARILDTGLEVPEYQRGYRWEEDQWAQLWRDLGSQLNRPLTDQRVTDFFLGSVFLGPLEEEGPSARQAIIDGQQRLATLTIIFRCLLDALGRIDPEAVEQQDLEYYLDPLDRRLRNVIYLREGPTQPILRIQMSERNQTAYSLVMFGEPHRHQVVQRLERGDGRHSKKKVMRTTTLFRLLGITPDAELEQWMQNRNFVKFDFSSQQLVYVYDYFSEKFENLLDPLGPDERIRVISNISNYILYHFRIARLEVTENDLHLMMNIFELLNDRGIPLTVADVIRARIIQKLRAELAEDEADRLVRAWNEMVSKFGEDYSHLKEYLIDYFAAEHAEAGVRSDVAKKVLDPFNLYPNPGEDSLPSRLSDIQTARALVQDLTNRAEAYLALSGSPDYSLEFEGEDETSRAEGIIRRLDALKTRQWMPFVFRAYASLEAGELTEDEFLEILSTVELVSLRQVLARIHGNRMESLYRDAAVAFRGTSDEGDGSADFDSMAFFGEAFQDKYRDYWGDRLVSILIDRDSWGRKGSKVALWKLAADEAALDQLVIGEIAIDDIHLEHVAPRSLKNRDNPVSRAWIEALFSPLSEEIEGRGLELGGIPTNVREDMARMVVEDIGNLVLLIGSENSRLQNKQLARKLRGYYSVTGFSDLDIHREFTFQYLPSGAREFIEESGDEGDEESAEIAERLDSWWDINLVCQRRARIISEVLRILELPGENLLDHFSTEQASRTPKDRVRAILAEHAPRS